MPPPTVGSVFGAWQWLQNQEGQPYFFNSETKVPTSILERFASMAFLTAQINDNNDNT
jgi:hypothetical protein